MEKRRDHYLGNEYSQIHYLQSLVYLVLHAMHQDVWPADYLVLSGALGKPYTIA